MEKLRMPASYATLPEEELSEIFGGGELGDALDSFTDNLHLDDFFLQTAESLLVKRLSLLIYYILVDKSPNPFLRIFLVAASF